MKEKWGNQMPAGTLNIKYLEVLSFIPFLQGEINLFKLIEKRSDDITSLVRSRRLLYGAQVLL